MEAVPAEVSRDDLEQWVGVAESTQELTLRAHLRPAQDGDTSALAAGSVDLPTQRSIGGCHLYGGVGPGAHEVGVQAALGVHVLDHRPSQRVEVRGQHGVSRLLGGVAELLQLGRALTFPVQAGDCLLYTSRCV